MPPKKSGTPTKRRPLREWITDVLRESGPLTTTKLRKKVGEKTGAKYHMNSMYLALRSLKKNGAVSATRKGRQRFYALGRKVEVAAQKAKVDIVAVAQRAEQKVARRGRPPEARGPDALRRTEPVVGPRDGRARGAAHRLAMGEIAIVDVDKDTVLSAANVHGELVLKRHPVPSK